ncbi:hypothetical protein Peur_041153 [Populus x canadensis]
MNTLSFSEKTKGVPVKFRGTPSALPVQFEDIIGLLTVTVALSAEIFSTSMLIRLIKALAGLTDALHSMANHSFM